MKRLRFRFKLAALLLFALFGLLAIYGIYSVRMYGSRWFSYSSNPRLAQQKEQVTAGDILDRSGSVLASTAEGRRVYSDRSEIRKALVHLLGDENGLVTNGVESFHAGYLYGYTSSLSDAIHYLTHSGEKRKGNSLTLTVDSDLCASVPGYYESRDQTRGKSGAAVVLNYLTGEIFALVSLPSFDPEVVSDASALSDGHPERNRAAQQLYSPGDLFRIVATTAAFENRPDAASKTFACGGTLAVSDTYTVHELQDAAHGSLTLEQAFLLPCRTAYASLAVDLGSSILKKAASRFGFNMNFLFQDLIVYNSVYPSSELKQDALVSTALGRGSVTVTPLHMCLIAAAVANDGKMPEPLLLKQVANSAGNPVRTLSPSTAMTVCSAETARKISRMMKDAVQGEGTVSQASVTTLDIRGITAVSESGPDEEKRLCGWFAGFNAQHDLPLAVCVLVEDISAEDSGDSTAAFIARDIFTWFKTHPETVSR